MTGSNVHRARERGTRVERNAANATVPVGCLFVADSSHKSKRGREMSAERTRQINALFKELEKAITSQMNATKRVGAITAQIDAAQAEERRAATKAKREARGKS